MIQQGTVHGKLLDFRGRVYLVVAQIPDGRVMTYGDIAGYCGIAHAARVVGGLAHFGPSELPWHRVVNRFGGLASGFHGGREVQAQLLAHDGVTCANIYHLPLIVITGPTASGKTALSIKLAKQFNGEIICADSRTVYKHMDIGTAKPTVGERQGIAHWGLDLVEPGERFTAADFQKYARQKIVEIQSRGKQPIIVGGTGLYIDSVLYDFKFPVIDDVESKRKVLDKLSLNDLSAYCAKHNVELPENYLNKRHVINAILRKGQSQKSTSSINDNMIVVAITTETTILKQRINERAEQIFASGVVEEAISLGKKYGWDSEAMSGVVYPLIKLYLDGTVSLDTVIERFKTKDWQLAKRQLTWLRRNADYLWLDLDSAETYLVQKLATCHHA